MTAPIGAHVREILKSVRYTMVELLLIWVGFCIGLADAFSDNLGVAFFMARIFAILALHTSGVFEELPTKSTTHDVVKLLEDKFVAVKLMYFFFALTYGAFTIEANVKRPSVFQLFCCHTSVPLYSLKRTLWGLLKLNVNWILPTGSRANQAMTSPGFERGWAGL